MPKDTFFRLQEEKRNRILDAADSEFRRVPYTETSINRIIKAAEIPRGSFYQYFEDKLDLFLYLITERYEMIQREMKEILRSVEGDCFRFIDALIDIFDSMFREGKRKELILLMDENLLSILIGEHQQNRKLKQMGQDLSDYLIRDIDFENISVKGREEQLYLVDILQSVIINSARTIFQNLNYVDPREELRKLRGRIHSIESHYRR